MAATNITPTKDSTNYITICGREKEFTMSFADLIRQAKANNRLAVFNLNPNQIRAKYADLAKVSDEQFARLRTMAEAERREERAHDAEEDVETMAVMLNQRDAGADSVGTQGEAQTGATVPPPVEVKRRGRPQLTMEEVERRTREQAARATAPGMDADTKPKPNPVLAACAAASCEQSGDRSNMTFDEARECLAQNGLLPEKVSDILAREPVPVDWIITDILAARGQTERGFKGDIIGGSKKRKTFFALQLAASVSAGRDLFDLPQYHIPKPRKVLYLNLELRKDCGEARIRKIAARFGANFDNLEMQTPVKPYLLRNRYDNYGNLIEGCEDAFIAYVRYVGYELVIVDPQYKVTLPAEDENSGQGIGGILRWRDRIITETNASCLIVHHDNKSGGIDKDITQRGAGSGYGGRDYDVRFALSDHVQTEEDDSYEILECSSRVSISPEDLTIIFNHDSWIFDAHPETPATKKTGKARRGGNMTQKERAEQFNAEQATMSGALADIITNAGSKLLARGDVEKRMYELGFQQNKVKDLLKQQCGTGKPYVDQPELDRDSKTGKKYHGCKFYTTHELAAAYRDTFQRLAL